MSAPSETGLRPRRAAMTADERELLLVKLIAAGGAIFVFIVYGGVFARMGYDFAVMHGGSAPGKIAGAICVVGAINAYLTWKGLRP